MKEVTYEEWKKNPTPREMWVWNNDFSEREKGQQWTETQISEEQAK